MTSIHVTSAHDALDLICLRHYGRQAGAVEQVLAVNPHIAAIAHRLPMGQKITLPDLVAQARTSPDLRLWD